MRLSTRCREFVSEEDCVNPFRRRAEGPHPVIGRTIRAGVPAPAVGVASADRQIRFSKAAGKWVGTFARELAQSISDRRYLPPAGEAKPANGFRAASLKTERGSPFEPVIILRLELRWLGTTPLLPRGI